METAITAEIARKVLDVVDAGLISGVGSPIPGRMCVEAAVCYALGLPHGDNPDCVAPALRSLKIRLNDANWSSDQARAKGLRRLAIAQLGSASHLDEKDFCRRVVDYALCRSCPAALRSAASIQKDPTRNTTAAVYAAVYAAVDAANAAAAAVTAAKKKTARDKSLAAYAEDIVQILIEMKVPGCQWLELTELAT